MPWEEVTSLIQPARNGLLVWKRCLSCRLVGMYPASQTVCTGLKRQPCSGVLVRQVWTEHLAPRDGRGEPVV